MRVLRDHINNHINDYINDHINSSAVRQCAALATVFLVLLFAACSSDRSTGPGTDATPPAGSLLVVAYGTPVSTTPALVLKRDDVAIPVSTGIVLDSLAVGTWTLEAASFTVEGIRYDPQPASQSVTVLRNSQTSISVHYMKQAGTISVAIEGLPWGAAAAVTLIGPTGAFINVAQTADFTDAKPGFWQFTASSVMADNIQWTPDLSAAEAQLVAGGSHTFVVRYTPVSAALAVGVTGVPAGAAPHITLSGIAGDKRETDGTTLFTGLNAGVYTVAASDISNSSGVWRPATREQQVTLQVGVTTRLWIDYVEAPPLTDDDFSIANAYVTQAVQRQDGGVPLVAGKPALLRVFGINNRTSTLAPAVEVRVFNGNTLLRTEVVPAPEATLRTTPSEAVLNSSWNLQLTAAEVTPGLRIQLRIDPSDEVNEQDETNNIWPVDGSTRAISVYWVPPFNIRLIPVINNELTGRVYEDNKETYVAALKEMFPVNVVNVTTGPAYTTTAAALTSEGTNWSSVLGEIMNLRSAQGATATYYGVVRVGYTSGVAGIAYVGAPVGIGWDYSGSNLNALVAAHELGHTFGRWHSPCSVTAQLHPGYPYSGGRIGNYGYRAVTSTLYAPTAGDIMGYCFDNSWISDFTFEGVMSFRGVSSTGGSDVAPFTYRDTRTEAIAGGLLVSATVTGGHIALDAALRVPAFASEPPRSATHIVEALDQSGRVLTSVPAQAMEIDHITGVRHISVVVPWSERLEKELVTVRVRDLHNPLSVAVASTAAERVAVGNATQMVLPEPEVPSIAGAASNRVRIQLASGYRDALVRDGVSGEVLGFVRNGIGEVSARPGQPLEIVYSDGVRSVTRRYR